MLMRSTIPLQSRKGPGSSPCTGKGESARALSLEGFVRRTSRLFCPLLVAFAAVSAALLLFGSHPLAAQAPAASPASVSPQKPIHHRTRPSAAHPKIVPAQVAPAPITPPPPAHPDWPVNDRPAQASVVWDSQGLRINAQNSSLQQILKDVSTVTGAKVEGLAADERIFGVYGPGQARDVLSQLLQGSSYNVMMIGDQGQGTPRQILLSARRTGDTQPAANNSPASGSDDDNEAEEPPQPQAQPPAAIRPGFAPGGAPRTPQQIMQEMQQRQQQIEQRANPPN